MSLAQILQQSGVIDSMASELGVDPRTAQTAAGALLPAIVAGMGRASVGGGPASGLGAASPDPLGGLGSLAGALLGGGSGASMLDVVLGAQPTPVQQGNDILGNIFGSKDVSRSIAGEVSAITGIDEGVLKKMLPILAMAVGGYMAKQATGGAGAGQGGALGGVLGSIISGMMTR